MKLNPRELATTLVALRNLQNMLDDGVVLKEAFPETFDEAEPLDEDEIEALCERLNTHPGAEGEHEDPPTPLNTDEGIDEFLDVTTHAVKDKWLAAGGREMTPDELYAINDFLTQFFTDKRPA